MRQVRFELVPVETILGEPGRSRGRILCRDLQDPGRTTLRREGHRLERPDDLRLDATESRPLHLAFLQPGDIGEDEAGLCVARALAGPGVSIGRPVQSQVTRRAAGRVLVAANRASFRRLSRHSDITIFTLPDGMTVEEGRSVAGAKITRCVSADQRSRNSKKSGRRWASG